MRTTNPQIKTVPKPEEARSRKSFSIRFKRLFDYISFPLYRRAWQQSHGVAKAKRHSQNALACVPMSLAKTIRNYLARSGCVYRFIHIYLHHSTIYIHVHLHYVSLSLYISSSQFLNYAPAIRSHSQATFATPLGGCTRRSYTCAMTSSQVGRSCGRKQHGSQGHADSGRLQPCWSRH